MAERGPLPPINFAALASALLARAHTLVPLWLPGGAQRGHEYFCGSLSGGSGDSCAVNTTSGKWADFATDERGNDLVSLYAAINGLDQGKAAVQVAREEHLQDVAGVQHSGADASTTAAPPRPPRPPDPPAQPKTDAEGWVTLTPVPAFAPEATFKHFERKPDTIIHTAAYRMADQLLGYVVRFKTSDGGKETLPYTWCTSARDGASRWHWRQWDLPRPLYVPLATMPAGRTVVLVEGEIKAEVLQGLLEAGAPGVYLVVSWPGGCKAWKKARWDWLVGCTVLLWPDCDAKREPLTKKEREQYADDVAREIAQAAKALLPVSKQPGMAAMLGIGGMLRDWKHCDVQLLPIPAPGEVADGWDCKDAIATDGWDFARVLAFFGSAGPLPSPADDEPPAGKRGAKAGRTGTGAAGGGDGEPPGGEKIDGPADAEDDGDEFRQLLFYMCTQANCKIHELGVTRKLLIAALRKAPLLRDCLGFNEMTGTPCTRVAWPWRSEAGPLVEYDDLRLGDFLCTHYKLKAASRAALAEAIDTVADGQRFHPIRAHLKALKHDGVPRSDKWLIHALGLHPDNLPEKLLRYYELVGRLILLGLVARVMDPGCKFDYSPVFEGITGMRKSTLIKVLVGKQYFSDTHFDIANGGKQGFEQFKGLWAFEMSELTPLRRADSDQVKQFFSSEVDRFRGAYGKYVEAHQRQVVIFCSTNRSHYLYDLTGNRRFWPVRVDMAVNIEWVAKWRDQLFAEALAMYQAGVPIFPSLEEERLYFVPEQNKRMVESAVQSRLYEMLTREGAPGAEAKGSSHININTTFVTLDGLVSALGSDAAKSSTLLESQITGWLNAHGWKYGRESTGQRRRGFKQPATWPPQIDDEEGGGGVPPPKPNGSPQAQAGPTQGNDDDPF